MKVGTAPLEENWQWGIRWAQAEAAAQPGSWGTQDGVSVCSPLWIFSQALPWGCFHLLPLDPGYPESQEAPQYTNGQTGLAQGY